MFKHVSRILLLTVLGIAVLSCSRSVVAGTGWQRLGDRTVSGRRDIDTINVGARKGTFHRIRFDVTGSAVDIYSVVVHFANGEKFAPDTRYAFGKGSTSRTIDLPGNARNIEKVVFKYGNLVGGGRAHVILFGES